ncbi:MAG: FecR domain-containing protein, partial [Clostridia bacterium]|nr:FecR domain-containing protein [Clostridia bacterium]
MNHMKAAARIMILLALILAMISGSTMAESYDAGTMRLLRYEGSVEIFDPEGVPRFVLENVRFASGETMQTGEDGIASVGLDDTKIVTLDASSRVQFVQEDSHLKLSLSQGSLFLDVQDKLDENESLDIETSTMTVGIRGTIAFLQEDPEGISSAGGRGATSVGILEGVAQIDFKDASGARRRMDVPAGRKVTIPAPDDEQGGVAPEMAQLTLEDISGFVAEQVLRDPVLIERVINGSPEGEEILHPGTVKETSDTWIGFDFPADGDWVWGETVTLAAQSASKLYDGQTLRRSSDVLVYGLPQGLSIQVAAKGALTDVGETENAVGNYHIYNAAEEDVTNHFTSVEKVSGTLKVDPAPLTVWTGSAEKYYDGTPLTNEEAELRTVPGYEVNEPVWRNTSIVTRSALGSESMISVSGATWVHGTNPLTGETREIILYTGQKLTVCLNSEENQESIDFMVETLPVEKLPEEVLRLYAANPELRTRACKDAGWDETKLKKRIAELGKTEGRTVTRKGLRVPETVENDLMQDSSNVRITVDSDVTNYNSRPLNGDEAHFVPIEIDPTISIEAIGSQTEPGESLNTYEIKWGRANPKNYLISEELGTLTVLPVYKNETTLTAASVEKVYDGKPLENTEFEIAELPEGYTVEAKVEGSLTDAGEAENKITEYKILDEDGKDATKAFPNLKVVSGTLKVTPAPLTVKTGSAEKVYDGEALVSEEAEITGLVNDEKAEIAATGSLTEAGTAKNTYTITWDTAKKENYEIQETVGTLTVEELKIEVGLGGTETSYNGGTFIPQPVLTYLNGSHAGETVSGTRLRAMDVMYRFALFTGETVDLTISGMGTDAGTYTLTGSAATSTGSSINLDLTFSKTELQIAPATMTITTGSASKYYDGMPLTCEEVTWEGMQGEDTITVTASGEIREAGSTQNTYEINWGDVIPDNYIITEKLGTLTVLPVYKNETTLTAASVEKVYDGKP